jgi:hypothetical protein
MGLRIASLRRQAESCKQACKSDSPAISMILGRNDVGMSEIQGHKSNATRPLDWIREGINSSSSRLQENQFFMHVDTDATQVVEDRRVAP